MNKNFEEEYKNEILSDLPDLWSRIEASLPDIQTIQTTDEAETNNEEIEKDVVDNNTNTEAKTDNKTVVKKKKKKSLMWIYPVITAVAAIAVVIPLALALVLGGARMMIDSKSLAPSSSETMYFTSVSKEEELDEACDTIATNDYDYISEPAVGMAPQEIEEEAGDLESALNDILGADSAYENSSASGSFTNSNNVHFDNYYELGEYTLNTPPAHEKFIADFDKDEIISNYMNVSHEEIYNHTYDYTTDFDAVTSDLVCTNLMVVVTGFYSNEQGINVELMVLARADECFETSEGRYFDFLVNECLVAHVYNNEFENINVGEAYNCNIFQSTDGSIAQWWEFVVKD